MNRASTVWHGLFPTLASGDRESQQLLDAARLVTMPADQSVFRAGSLPSNKP